MKKLKFTPDKLMISVFSVIILGISISTLVLPKQERSENENRSLAKFPSLVNEAKLEKAENFGDFLSAVNWKYITERKEASFMDDFETYFADHLVGRDLWVEGANAISRLTGKQEINGVYTVDNQMIQSFRKYDEEEVAKSIAAMNKFAERFPEKQMSFMLVPTAQELLRISCRATRGFSAKRISSTSAIRSFRELRRLTRFLTSRSIRTNIFTTVPTTTGQASALITRTAPPRKRSAMALTG